MGAVTYDAAAHHVLIKPDLFNIEVLAVELKNSKVAPLHMSLNAPAILMSPMELGLPSKIAENIEPFGKKAVRIAGIVVSKIVAVDVSKKVLVIDIPIVLPLLTTVKWVNNDLMNNQVEVKTEVPNVKTIADITVDWKCQSLLSCTRKTDAVILLPLVWDVQISDPRLWRSHL